MVPKVVPVAIRLERNSRVSTNRGWNGTPCREWTASVGKRGYACMIINTRGVGVHRAAYELAVGEIPPGLTIDHLCQNTICINPLHMEPVTRAENLSRAARRMTGCRKFGHPLVAGKNGKRHCKECPQIESKRRAAEGYWKKRRQNVS